MLSQFAINALQRTDDLLNLGEYSPATKRNYLQELRYLFCYYVDVRPSQITYEQTLDYLIYLNKTLHCSRVKSKMAANSFAFFFKQVCNKPYKIPSILFAAHSNKLPAVMLVEEVFAVIEAIQNVKHKTLIILLYSTGMRLNEIANLKIADIDSQLMRIKIVNGKGKKDRFVLLSPLVLTHLRNYYLQYKPELYLFNGSGKGKKYACRTIQHILQHAIAKIGLEGKCYSVHSVRHSFATHLIDNGADIQLIQELLGHQHISQTIKYLHLSSKRIQKTANPFDAMMAQMNATNPVNKTA
jgi:integrase/recombinase XerD